MIINYTLHDVHFEWDREKAASNLDKHGVLDEPHDLKGISMKSTELKKRLRKDRPMTSITLRMPEAVVADLKRIAPQLGFSGYQALMRAYIGQGLRQDLARLEDSPFEKFVESLKRHGVERAIITEAMAEVG